jgi:hypothetical protein
MMAITGCVDSVVKNRGRTASAASMALKAGSLAQVTRKTFHLKIEQKRSSD